MSNKVTGMLIKNAIDGGFVPEIDHTPKKS